jgi:NitT/TauT family transport system substrate-binding protein
MLAFRAHGSVRTLAPLALVATLALTACGGASSSGNGAASNGNARYNGTIKIASSTWTGYAVIYVANARGIWKAHNLDVSFTDVEDPVQRLQALNAGQLQGMASTVDAFARAQAQGVPAVDVFPIDASVGGDGILAKNSIQSIKDVKGKTVAVNQGSVSEWFLAQVLLRNGMSLKDVTEENMTSGQAGAAFVAGRVDVAVTWEPWLTRASKTSFGRVLVSSKQYPDLIMDAFAFRRDFVQKYPGSVRDFVKAYYDAYDWMVRNQDQANQLIGSAVKESASDVEGDLSTMTIFSLSQAKEVMGSNDHPGKIFSNAKAAGDFWKSQGQVSQSVDPKQAVDASFVASM